jgi:DNA gyrase subunit B/topoisomerase-4 subunit B
MANPQFQGQTKDKLNNPEAHGLVSSALRLELEHYLNTHPTAGEAIATRVIQAAKARQASRAAASRSRKSTSVSHRLNLPGKLADCSSTDPNKSELFIVEGDSAGGSAKQGRDRNFQAVLPLRGKVLNAEQASMDKVQSNKELSNVVDALGCGLQDQLNLTHLRYEKVILLMDADSDGHHIATLLLTFFYRYMRPLIDEGHIYLAQPPLYRIASGQDTYWALDDLHKDHIIEEIHAKRKNAKIDIQRFKGLGEMMPATLKETTLDPESRHLLRVTIADTEKLITEQTVSELMGKDTSARFEFIMEHAGEVDDLDV